MPKPLAIDISGVTFTYPGSEVPVLSDATLAVEQGSFLAIVGGNGCGKSTLCKLFNGLIPHYYSGDFAGEVNVCGLSSKDKSVAELSAKVGYVYQDFENQLVRPTVLDEACFAPLNYGLPDYRDRALRALDLCGLGEFRHRYIWELSGGQKHLLALAGALSLAPDVLVVDEPVSQLDPSHARQVYEVLRKLNRDYGKTVVVIEHHPEFIADYCGEVCLMEQGRVLWKLPTLEALNRIGDLERLGIQPPEVAQAAAKLDVLLQAAPDKDARPVFPALPRPYPVTTEAAVPYFAGLLRGAGATGRPSDNANAAARTEDGSPSAPPEGRTVVAFRDAGLTYRTVRKNERPVLRGVRLDIREGERIALIGNNGAGKSSLLKLIAGISRPSAGSVSVLGLDTRSVSVERLSEHVAFVFQNPSDMFIDDHVRKEIAYYLQKRGREDAEATVEQMLRSFRLEELRDRDARLLSGGQQRRVTLAIGAAIRPEIMLLDEPTANLDLATREELLGTLEELRHHVRTVIIATHDMQLVSRWATRAIVMSEGTVAADGTPADIFADPDLIRRAGLALTQSLELSAELALSPPCASPEELAERLFRLIARKEDRPHAARPQLVP